MPRTPLEPTQQVGVHVKEGSAIVLTVSGCLDEHVAGDLIHVAEQAIDDHAVRLDIDLRPLTSFTAGGAAALLACRELCARLPEGLHYRTEKGAGRDALLAAFSESG